VLPGILPPEDRKKTLKTPIAALLAASLFIASCSKDAAAPAPAPQASAEFAEFVDEYFDASLRYSPAWATYVGIHDYDRELDDRSREAIEARIVQLHGYLDLLLEIDRTQLLFDEQIDAEALEADIRAELFDTETLRTWETNPMGYVSMPGGAIGGLIKRDFAPAAERLASVTSRLRQVPFVYQAARANLKNPPKEFTELAIRMARGAAAYLDDSVAAWAKDAAGDDAALLADFTSANAAAVAATKSFAGWLEKDLLPASRGRFAIGADNFSKKLLYEEMVSTPLDEILAIGEAQLAKDHQEFVETAKQIDPARTPAEVMKALSDDHPTAEDLVPSVRRTVEEARQFVVDHGIVTVPSEVRVQVEETPPYARSGSFASMSTPGPYETKAVEAYYYVTPVEPTWDAKHQEEHLRFYNKYIVAMINVHEAYPGHYLQFLYAPRFPTKVRKLVGAGTNSEGWAHYAEQMMLEQGFGGGDPRYRLAQLQEALKRDCRYVAGIKLHTEGWTVERAAKELFVDQCFEEPANGFEEARRGAYNPTYLYYTLGKIEIQKLRDEYMQKKGASLKQFHDDFVSQGALPIPLVRRILLER
jgi:uncharacterized protein (DUF885 family)